MFRENARADYFRLPTPKKRVDFGNSTQSLWFKNLTHKAAERDQVFANQWEPVTNSLVHTPFGWSSSSRIPIVPFRPRLTLNSLRKTTRFLRQSESNARWPWLHVNQRPYSDLVFIFHGVSSHPPQKSQWTNGGTGWVAGHSTLKQVVLVYSLPVADQWSDLTLTTGVRTTWARTDGRRTGKLH